MFSDGDGPPWVRCREEGPKGRRGAGGAAHRRTRRRLAAAAAAALTASLGGPAARADIAGFSGFAPVNTNGVATSPGYSSDGTTFNTTDRQNSEAVSGFFPTPQVISSFNTTFTITATGDADGTAFVLQNSTSGTSALGQTGGSLGYQGIGNSAALGIEYFGTNGVAFATNGGAFNGYVG